MRRPTTLIALAVLLAAGGCAAWRIGQSARWMRRGEPLQQRPAVARVRLLIVGDSTAVGTGASAPAFSLAGLIAAGHPALWLTNQARDGARFSDLPAQLLAASAGQPPFDAVLIQAGGNDVIRLTRLQTLHDQIDRVLQQARGLAPLVVLMPCGNVGNAPLFFPPLSWLMTRRSRELRRDARQAAAGRQADYVDLFKERADDPFARERDLDASDGLHPSDAGYRVWYGELMAQSRLGALLSRAL